MKYAVIYFMIYTSPNEIKSKQASWPDIFSIAAARETFKPLFKFCDLTPAGWRKVPIGVYTPIGV